jgi:hypothetical protein
VVLALIGGCWAEISGNYLVYHIENEAKGNQERHSPAGCLGVPRSNVNGAKLRQVELRDWKETALMIPWLLL